MSRADAERRSEYKSGSLKLRLHLPEAIRCFIFIAPKITPNAGFIACIKTHDSESRGQEEAGRTRRMSVLFTGNTAMKFVNALNKPP